MGGPCTLINSARSCYMHTEQAVKRTLLPIIIIIIIIFRKRQTGTGVVYSSTSSSALVHGHHRNSIVEYKQVDNHSLGRGEVVKVGTYLEVKVPWGVNNKGGKDTF